MFGGRKTSSSLICLDIFYVVSYRWAHRFIWKVYQWTLGYKMKSVFPASILYKSIAGRYRPVRVADGPITARYRFIKNAYWVACYTAYYSKIDSIKPKPPIKTFQPWMFEIKSFISAFRHIHCCQKGDIFKSSTNIANSLDSDETAHCDPSHLDLHCMQNYLLWSTGLNGLRSVSPCLVSQEGSVRSLWNFWITFISIYIFW